MVAHSRCRSVWVVDFPLIRVGHNEEMARHAPSMCAAGQKIKSLALGFLSQSAGSSNNAIPLCLTSIASSLAAALFYAFCLRGRETSRLLGSSPGGVVGARITRASGPVHRPRSHGGQRVGAQTLLTLGAQVVGNRNLIGVRHNRAARDGGEVALMFRLSAPVISLERTL
jgi:hypothetical protein